MVRALPSAALDAVLSNTHQICDAAEAHTLEAKPVKKLGAVIRVVHPGRPVQAPIGKIGPAARARRFRHPRGLRPTRATCSPLSSSPGAASTR
jgi:hypothetical protein